MDPSPDLQTKPHRYCRWRPVVLAPPRPTSHNNWTVMSVPAMRRSGIRPPRATARGVAGGDSMDVSGGPAHQDEGAMVRQPLVQHQVVRGSGRRDGAAWAGTDAGPVLGQPSQLHLRSAGDVLGPDLELRRPAGDDVIEVQHQRGSVGGARGGRGCLRGLRAPLPDAARDHRGRGDQADGGHGPATSATGQHLLPGVDHVVHVQLQRMAVCGGTKAGAQGGSRNPRSCHCSFRVQGAQGGQTS